MSRVRPVRLVGGKCAPQLRNIWKTMVRSPFTEIAATDSFDVAEAITTMRGSLAPFPESRSGFPAFRRGARRSFRAGRVR